VLCAVLIMGQNKTKLKRRLKEEDQTNRPSLKISLSKSAGQESSATNSTVSTDFAEASQSPIKQSRSSRKGRKDAVSEKKLQHMFDQYRDPATDTIAVTGVMKFIDDLGLQAEDIVLLVIAWHLQAREMGTFTKEEFTGGFRKLGLDTVDRIRDALDNLRAEVKDEAKFLQIYKYAFNFYREPDRGKTVDINTADSLLGLLLPECRHVDKMREFLKIQTEYKSVTTDQWLGIFEFSKTIKDDFSNLADDAWPSLIDSYVEWARQHDVKKKHSNHSRHNTHHEESKSAERSTEDLKSSRSDSE